MTPQIALSVFLMLFEVSFEGQLEALFFYLFGEGAEKCQSVSFFVFRSFLCNFWVFFLQPSKKHVNYKENGPLETPPGRPFQLLMLLECDFDLLVCDSRPSRASVRLLFEQLLLSFWTLFWRSLRELPFGFCFKK